mmetsp:Transcript_19470/g.58847  ORF Transcript_19470/g.58847 Transcript_19470/m.58847 type:complete len:617 (-) Transcript_19470:3229-5079(-)
MYSTGQDARDGEDLVMAQQWLQSEWRNPLQDEHLKRVQGDQGQQGPGDGGAARQAMAHSGVAASGFDELPLDVAGRVFELLPPSDIKMARLVSRAWMREVSRSAQVCRPAVSKLKKTQALFPALTRLDMCKAHGVTAEHLPQLARMVRLEWLSLKRCRAVTDGSLAGLAPLTRLTHLSLARCFKVTDAGVEIVVAALPQLESLNLKALYRLSDAGVAACARLPHLTALNLTSCRKVTDAAMGSLAAGAPCLRDLKITDCFLIGDAGLTAATALTALTSLQARLGHQQHAARSDAGWRSLLPCLSCLVRLALSCRGPEEHAGAITDATLTAIAGLTALQELRIDQAYAATDAGVAALAALRRLTSLQLHETRRLTDGGLEALGALGRLQRMVLADQGQLSDRGIAAAGTRLPLLRRLALRQCSGITGVCASVFAGLEDLEVTSCPAVTDDSIAVLAGAAGGRLRSLALDGCPAVSDAVLPQLAAALPRLQALSLSECQGLRCEALTALAPLGALSRLDLSLCKHLSDEPTMASLAGLEALEVVNVSMCPKLTDAGLEVLAANMPPRLRHVTVAGCEYVTKQGAAELQGALPAHPGGALQRLVEFNHQSPTLKELLLR